MKMLLLAGVAAVALVGRAEAQQYQPLGPGWDPASAAYLGGPPMQREPQAHITWQGMTQWGRTVYFSSDDGRQGVMWQVNPAAPWQYKVNDGETGTVPVEQMAPQQTVVPARGDRMCPAGYSPGYGCNPAAAPNPGGTVLTSNGVEPYERVEARQARRAQQEETARQQEVRAALTMFGMAFCAMSGRCY